MITVKTPKPKLVFSNDGGSYAWSCEHKKYGLRVLGDSQVEAIADFRACIADEMLLGGFVKERETINII